MKGGRHQLSVIASGAVEIACDANMREERDAASAPGRIGENQASIIDHARSQSLDF